MAQWLLRWFKTTKQYNTEQLMQAFSETGEAALLDELVKRLGDDIYHYLLSQCDAATAADICQATWLKVIEKRQQYQDKGNVKGWLFTLARNQMLDHMRQAAHWQTLSISGDDHISECMERVVGAEQDLIQFNKMMARLPFLQKEAFILQQEGFSLMQIAEITGENLETIKSRLRYARNFFSQVINLTQQEEAS